MAPPTNHIKTASTWMVAVEKSCGFAKPAFSSEGTKKANRAHSQ